MAQGAITSLLGRLATVVAVALTFLLALVGTVVLSLHSPNVKVPEVVGKSASEAENILADAGLNVRTRARRFSAEVKPDTVLDQAPRPGVEVKKGQTIAVVLSRGEAKEGESSVGVTPQGANANNANGAAQQSNAGESGANNTNNANNANKPKKTNKNKNANNSNNANGNLNAAGNVNSNLSTNLAVNSTNTGNAGETPEPTPGNRNTAPPRNANANAPRNLNANSAGVPTLNLNGNALRSRTVTNRNANRRPPAD